MLSPALFSSFPTTDPPAIAAALLVVSLAAVLLFSRSRTPWLSHIQRKPVLTNNEKEFFYRLKRALPACHVLPQVSFAAVITDDGKLSAKARWAVRAKFDRKIIDYVICDRDFQVLEGFVAFSGPMHIHFFPYKRDFGRIGSDAAQFAFHLVHGGADMGFFIFHLHDDRVRIAVDSFGGFNQRVGAQAGLAWTARKALFSWSASATAASFAARRIRGSISARSCYSASKIVEPVVFPASRSRWAEAASER